MCFRLICPVKQLLIGEVSALTTNQIIAFTGSHYSIVGQSVNL